MKDLEWNMRQNGGMRKECEGKCRNENGIYRKVAGSGRSVLKGKIND